MARKRETVLVLWGKNFDEAAATLFVTMLRESGLRVKVVGLDGPNTSGAHGLALVPDLTLSQAKALTKPISCIILPCAPTEWRRIFDDPRVEDFIHKAQSSGTQIVIEGCQYQFKAAPQTSETVFNNIRLPLCIECAINYPDKDGLLSFIQQTAEKLAADESVDDLDTHKQEPLSAIAH